VGGTCELCKTKFQFAPLYKENAPERLPFIQFLSGVSEIVFYSWLPSIFRVIFAIVLWIVVTPLLTAYLYQSWMVRPSAALSRFFSTTLIWSDICAGLVLTGIVIVSLLSIMSLADFLRVEWNRPQQVQQQQPIADDPPEQVAPENIDNAIWLHAQKAAGIQRQAQQAQVYNIEDDDTSWDDIDEDYEDLHSVDDSVDEDEQDPPQPPNNDDRQQQQERMAPPDIPPDDFDGVDINIAVDEMLGLRGPILVVVRNVLWVLTFNAIYLGFFAFVPRSVGYTFCSYAFNMTDPRRHNETHYLEALMFENATNSSVWSTIQTESIKHQTIFRLSDVVSITAGYLMIAVVTGLMQLFMSMYSKVRTVFWQDATREDGNNVMEPLNAFNPRGFDDANDGVAAVAVDYAVKTTFAIVKVGVLLFVKMFLFPIALGLALSWSTMAMIGMSTGDQVGYAGRDIFSFILLHWVAGITFMLLVTVSVLQLREVLHPDVCARVIRPQEPHPDLLGNLMRESIATHIRRMSMSFLIYSFLLFLFISLPTQLHVSFILPEFVLRELKLKFAYYFSSRLQAPLELLTFHFVMLTILEKYKNNIGVVQHRWLGFCSRALGLSKSILPYDVTSFRHLGSRPVFAADGSVDNFWFEVAKDDRRGIRLLEENKSSFSRRSNVFFCVKTKPNGEKVLVSGTDFIRLPKRLAGMPPRHTSIKLKTKLGRYRLKREAGRFQIQLWEEVRGDPIARPPEGWDDLGAGGAHAQGR
jgi:E3 ubiquitin-protein ligase MARCH6